MDFRYSTNDPYSDSVELLVSMLIRYPEISSICCEPKSKEIKFTFLLKNTMEDIKSFETTLNTHLGVFYRLDKLSPDENRLVIHSTLCGDLTVVELTRKLIGLTAKELNLIITLTKEFYKESLLVEVDELNKEEQIFQEDLIGSMLYNLAKTNVDQKLFAFRENGKVLVFNK